MYFCCCVFCVKCNRAMQKLCVLCVDVCWKLCVALLQTYLRCSMIMGFKGLGFGVSVFVWLLLSLPVLMEYTPYCVQMPCTRLLSISCMFRPVRSSSPDSSIRRSRRSLALLVGQLFGQPIQTLVQTVALRCARRLNVPVSIAQLTQLQLIG